MAIVLLPLVAYAEEEGEEEVLLTDEQMLTTIKRSLDDGQGDAEGEDIFVNYGLGNSGNQLKSQFAPSPTKVGIRESLEKYKNNAPKLIEDAYEATLLGHLEAALVLYKEALVLQPENLSVMFSIGSIYQRQNDYYQAKNYYKQVLEKNINHKKALNNYINLISEEDPEEAEATLKELLDIDPSFHPIHAQIGVFYAKQQEYPQAIKYLRQAIILDPDNVEYKYNLGVVYDRNKDNSLARAMYMEVLQASYAGKQIPVSKKALTTRIYKLNSQK